MSKGALYQAHYRLGPRPLVALFKGVCTKPLAQPETVPEAFLFGLRLMALDATVLDLPDTPEKAFEPSASATARAGRAPGPRRGWSP